MNAAAFVVALLVGGLVVGALARLALPGPDPLPLWATCVLGIAGSLIAGFATWALVGATPALITAVIASTMLLFLYRRLVQKRGITGPEAKRPPTRGWWLPRARTAEAPTRQKLDQLLRSGAITPEEYESLRTKADDGR
jgi:uncharacterized membrane protein YeaQ/YmgE (transglycosylase-associated protein family)